MQMPVDPHESLLNEILRAVPISDRPVDEVQQAVVIAPDQLLEREPPSLEVLGHKLGVIELLELEPGSRLTLRMLYSQRLRHSGCTLPIARSVASDS